MRAVIQRVKKAKVVCKDKVLGEIGLGLLVFLGIKKGDGEKDIEYLSSKILNLRIMADDKGKMNLSLLNIKGDILVVSQFTLYADTKKGKRPSFVKAEDPILAKKLYEKFVEKLKKGGLSVETGEFGALMTVEILNDGPVTLILDT